LSRVYGGVVSSAELAHSGESGLTADALLAGPLGRLLCVHLLDDRLTTPRRRFPRVWLDALHAARIGDARRCASKLGECVVIADLAGVPFDESALLAGLVAAVDFVSYWGEPDAADQGFADAAAREALQPVAEAVAVAVAEVPGVRWWVEPVDQARQHYAQFLDEPVLPEPQLTGAAERVRAWLADTCDHERSHGRPEDPANAVGGGWWSSPATSGLPVTTRGLPALGAIRLALAEDGFGWKVARCWPVAPNASARVYEVRGPGQWAALADCYPLDVSRSRRHDWWRATGWSGRWLIPDYAAAAGDWDAIHVSVAGYLTTAGLDLPAAAGARMMLAGWDPDATWWLNDVLSLTSRPEVWRRDDRDPFGWIRAQ
jgi:hypothetical protein